VANIDNDKRIGRENFHAARPTYRREARARFIIAEADNVSGGAPREGGVPRLESAAQ
jgi:hypothetical protein